MTEKKRGLGRGLDALIASSEPARSLPIDQLKPNRKQPRQHFDEEQLKELADSIRTQGVIQPIVVTPDPTGTYTIVAGERRWRASRLAGLTNVPVAILEGVDPRRLLELALVENLQRSDLNPIEEAEAYRSLQGEFGLSQELVAERVGKSRPAVTNALRLLRLPESVVEMLRTGELSAGQARPLLALESTDRQVELARRAVAESLSARALEALVAAPAAKRKKASKPPEVHAAAAAEKLTQRLQTKVEIRRRGKGGVVHIYYHSEEELMRLFDTLAMRTGGKS
ncbi:MAG: ParB/RepB/Spo0J family partition protein [Acidobacteriota bacterium]